MEQAPTVGRITVDPGVLETIARLSALAVPGVTRLTPPVGFQRLLGIEDGVKIVLLDDSVTVDLFVVAEAGHNLLALGRQIQTEVTRAILNIVGMPVTAVNVHIEDISGKQYQETERGQRASS